MVFFYLKPPWVCVTLESEWVSVTLETERKKKVVGGSQKITGREMQTVAFWRKVEDSKISGHDDLKTFLETNTKILLGESIPNKAFWEKVKFDKASKFLTKLGGAIADIPQKTKDNIVNIPQEDEHIENDKTIHIENYETIEYETVFRIILDNVYNGHNLILHILDSLVEKNDGKGCMICIDDKKEAKVKIDINQMFNFTSKTQTKDKSTKAVLSKKTKSLVRDLIDIQRERPGDDNIKKIFQHPVIEVLILKKWDDYKMPYIRDVRRFGFLVLLFTFFVRLRILGEAKKKCDPASAWEKRDSTTDFIDHILNCGDWVGSNISEEDLTRCDSRSPAYITDNSADCSNLVHNANVSWLVKNSDHWAHNLVPQNDDGMYDLVLNASVSWLVRNNSHWAHNLVPESFEYIYDRLLIFKYREDLFYISAAVMTCLIFTQVVLFLWELFQRFAWYGQKSEKESDKNLHNRKRINKIIWFRFVNLFYLLLGNIVCLGPKVGPEATLQVTLCVVLAYLIFIEVVQIGILVVRPAWKIFKSFKGICGSIKSLVGNRYFRDPDNYLEIICFISIPLALFNDTWPKTEEDAKAAAFYQSPAFCRGIIAMGVFAAWMELFIKMGNVSHSVVGNFIKMFYNIIKTNLLAYMQACLLLMTAFSLAFWIILEGHIKKTGVNF